MVIDMHHTRIWVARYSCIAQDSSSRRGFCFREFRKYWKKFVWPNKLLYIYIHNKLRSRILCQTLGLNFLPST